MSPRGRSALAPIFNHTYLSKLEKGASYPGLEMILKLATEIEVKRAEFFLGSIWYRWGVAGNV